MWGCPRGVLTISALYTTFLPQGWLSKYLSFSCLKKKKRIPSKGKIVIISDQPSSVTKLWFRNGKDELLLFLRERIFCQEEGGMGSLKRLEGPLSPSLPLLFFFFPLSLSPPSLPHPSLKQPVLPSTSGGVLSLCLAILVPHCHPGGAEPVLLVLSAVMPGCHDFLQMCAAG